MADARDDGLRNDVKTSEGACTSPPSSTPREPSPRGYRAPHLRYLGSVRELTWGDAGAYADGIASQQTP
jgi:hypothetical protein